MPPIKSLIPLFIASAFCLISIIPIILWSILYGSLSPSFPEMSLYSILIIIAIWLSLLFKNNLWAYLFLFSLLAGVFTSFQFGHFIFYFRIGPLHIDLFSLGLLIGHFGLNSDRIIIASTKEQVAQDQREEIDFFKKQHASKTNDALSNLLKKELVPAATSAIEEIIQERAQKTMKSQFPTLTSERLILRQFTDDDLENVFHGLSHPDIIKYYGISFDSLEATKEQMEWFADHEKNGTGIWWAVCSKADGTFLGAGGLNGISQEHKKAEIGFWLFPENWGKGIMFEAMSLIFTYSFETIGLKRVEGFVASQNTNCKKAVSKLGFALEETIPDAEMKDGEFISIDTYVKFPQ